MDGLLNNYEDVYRFIKNTNKAHSDELSSLDNNYSLKGEEVECAPFPNFFSAEAEPQSLLEIESQAHAFDWLAEPQEPVEPLQSEGMEISQNSISILDRKGSDFWQKGNFEFEQPEGESLQEVSKLPEIELQVPESLKQAFSHFENESTEDKIKDLRSYSQSEESDIEVEKPQKSAKIADLAIVSTQSDSSEKARISESSGFEAYAARYSWSQHQAYSRALEGVADDSAHKGSSEKELNALSIRRSCFRALSAYYKQSFSKFNRAWQQKRRNKKKTKDMNVFIDTYIQEEFAENLPEMHPEFYSAFRDAVIAILHSHRYKKEEEFTKGIDFSIIRDVLYSYTLEAKDRLINMPAYALIMHNFFVRGAYKYLESQVQHKSKLYAVELEKELVSLHKDAINTLK